MKVLLTGNTGGIGNCIEEQLKQSNIDVVGINSKICDLSNPLNIPFFLRKYDQFDGMVHCAGVNPIRSYKDINQQEFTKVFNINTFYYYYALIIILLFLRISPSFFLSLLLL